MTIESSASQRASIRDAVLLMPGFLGLGRVGRFYYFSERVAAVLRAAIEARAGRPVLVVPCYTRPIGSLERRQVYLLDQLQEVYDGLPNLERVHLVGHSAGAVDAQLLACQRPISAESWNPFPIRKLLSSVVGISAPYHGTFLAQAASIRTLRGELSLAGVRELLGLVGHLTLLLRTQPAILDVLAGARSQFPEAVSFVIELLRHQELMDDLHPDAMHELRKRAKPDRRIPLTSFVTMAGLDDHAPSPPDRFFHKLHELTGRSASQRGTVAEALRVLRAATTHELSEKTSDGVVNSALQLLDPSDPNELGGVIIGDHADVIGHYDRGKKLLEERSLQTGMFHSGSGFDDEEFFRLYGMVADAICRAIPDIGVRPAHSPSSPRLRVSGGNAAG